ncbi:MAG: transcription antitermination factor NusB [Candidatus Firestonebacteria bacterium]
MGARRKARELALQILFQIDVGELSLEEVYSNFIETQKLQNEVKIFALELAEGTLKDIKNIDSVIEKRMDNWQVSRLAAVDRSILRLATYELLNRNDIPISVTINEAIELAKEYSTSESGKFVNGILDGIKEEHKLSK